MTPTHSKRKGKVCHYYVTHTAQKRDHRHCPVRMVRAGDIEGIVFDQIKGIFRDPSIVVKKLRAAKDTPEKEAQLSETDIREGLHSLDAVWDHFYHAEKARLLQLFVKKILVEPEGNQIGSRANGVQSLVLDLKADRPESKQTTDANDEKQGA